MLKHLGRLFKQDRGSTSIEFAMVGIAFLTVALMICESGRMLWTLNGLQYATENAARYAVIHDEETDEEIVQYARDELGNMFIPSDSMEVQTEDIELSGIQFIEITSTYDFSFSFAFFLPEEMRTMELSAVSRKPTIPAS